MKWFMLLICLSLTLLLSGIGQIFAQESPNEEFTLEEIVVTAQKQAQNAQKVSMAMDVITSAEITTQGKSNLEVVLSNLSDAIVSRAQDGLRITLRGVTDDAQTNRGQAVSTPTVAINTDGVYSNRKNSGTDLFDVERVEVLYGPQSTLYASNSPGGIVNVVTGNPKLDKYEATGLLEYGNYNLLHTQGVMNAPISEKIAVRAAFSTSIHDGYLSNGGMDEDSKNARLRLLYQPAEKLSFMLTGEIGKTTSQQFSNVSGFADQSDVKPDPWQTTNALGYPTKNTTKKITGNMDWDVGFGNITLVPAYSTQSSKGQWLFNLGVMTYNHITEDSKEKTVELRMSSASGAAIKYVVGFNYYKSQDHMYMLPLYADGTITDFGIHWADMNETSKALFGNITYPITDRFRGTVGLRQSWDEVYNLKHLMNNDTVYNFKYDKPNYKLGVEYDLGKASMAYADYSTSYRFQGMVAVTDSTLMPPPQKLNAYNIGVKNRFLDNRLQVNASAYYYEFKNYNASQMVSTYHNTAPNQNVVNDPYFQVIDATQATGDLYYVSLDPGQIAWGNGKMYGIDVSTTAIISPEDSLKLSASYMKSEWIDFQFNFTYPWQFTGMSNPAGVNPHQQVDLTLVKDQSYNGEPMMASPKLTINGTYSHIFNLSNGGSLEAQIQETYKSSYKLTWNPDDYPKNYQEPYNTTDLSLTYTHSDGKWTLAAYGRNLENYAAKKTYFGAPSDETMISDPRTYGGVLTVKF